MTVSLITMIQRFQGLSTDVKPSSPPEGSTYYALDTGEEYVFSNGMWELDIRKTAALTALT